jgi:cell division septation protein DedD
MSDRSSSHQGISCALVSRGVLLILLSTLVIFPSAARTDIRHIGVGDTIFVYEQNLDIKGLRTGVNPVTSLRKYKDDNPTLTLLREVPVQDDTSFNPIPEAFGDLLGVYYAFNPTDGAMSSVLVAEPSVSIDAVLASPNHSDSIRGLTVSEKTWIAFKIVAVEVGSAYHAGALFPATVDIVLMSPGGAQLTSIQGKDFSKMNVSTQVFYTDDPGMPGAITFENLDAGTYTVQAKWHDPSSFDQQVPDSNIYSFSIGGTTVSTTNPPAPTPVVTTRTTTTPVPETTQATTPFPTVTLSTPPTTRPATTPPSGSPQPSPTPMPTGAWLAALSIAFAFFPGIRGRIRK